VQLFAQTGQITAGEADSTPEGDSPEQSEPAFDPEVAEDMAELGTEFME
jgi:hypothetical protein